jgi:hypothetical protein
MAMASRVQWQQAHNVGCHEGGGGSKGRAGGGALPAQICSSVMRQQLCGPDPLDVGRVLHGDFSHRRPVPLLSFLSLPRIGVPRWMGNGAIESTWCRAMAWPDFGHLETGGQDGA